jgi:ribosomal-protein-alanine N-acetyltransferase
MKAPETIQTERLVLRKPRMEDAPAIFQAYAQDPEVTRYLVWKLHQHIRETETFLERCLDIWEEGTNFPYVITLHENDDPIGMLEIHFTNFKIEIGYALARPYWGKGLMTEALQAVINRAFDQPGIFRVQAICDVENIVSARVMEKSGMIREGLLRRYILHPNVSDEPRDVYIYAIVK